MRALALAILLFANVASAHPGTTGYSGKTTPSGNDTCATSCHVGAGAAPNVDITFPSALKAGESGQITIVVDGTRQRTSMNAAFSVPVKATAGRNTEIPFPVETPDEVAAVAPPPSGADGTFTFSFVAPQRNGSLTLYVAAMSTNGAGTTGDGVAVTTRTITISGANEQPDAGTSPPKNGGASPSPSNPARSSTDAGSEDDSDEDNSPSATSRRLTRQPPNEASCRLTRGSHHTGVLAVIAVLLLVHRRRRAFL